MLQGFIANELNREQKNNLTIKRIFSSDGTINITYYFFNWGNYKAVYVWAGDTGAHTRAGSSWTLRKIFERFTPKVVFSLGVAFGIKRDGPPNGVIVSKRICSYDMGRKMTAGKIVIKKEHNFSISPWLHERFRQCKGFLSKEPICVRYGDIASGEAVVDDEGFKQSVIDAVSSKDLIGGEMEGYGLFSECANKEIPCAVIKGICDWGAGKNELGHTEEENDLRKDKIQAYAMHNCLQVVNKLFQDNILLKREPSDSNIIKFVDSHNKVLNVFKKYQALLYFLISLAFVAVCIYCLLQGRGFNLFEFIMVVAIIVGFLALVLPQIVLHKQKGILIKILDKLNSVVKTTNEKSSDNDNREDQRN